MPSGGARPGAGRPRGSGVKATPGSTGKKPRSVPAGKSDRRATYIRAQAARLGQKLAVDVLSEAMNFFYGLAGMNQPKAGEPFGGEQARQFRDDLLAMAQVARDLAPFQTPRLSSVTLQQLPPDLSNLTDDELADLERLHAKAANAGRDTGGAGSATTH